MKRRGKFCNIAAGISLLALSGIVYAGDKVLNLSLPPGSDFQTEKFQPLTSQSFRLAANEGGMVQDPAPVSFATPDAKFQEPWMTINKAHKYLGLGTLALVGLTAMTAPDNEGGGPPPTTGTHQSLGRTTAAMAVATVATGLLAHWDDIYLEDSFFDPDKMHAALGTLGALSMLYAVSIAPRGGHSSAGIAGGIAMGVAIKLTW
ncbi:MAG: hypothetical protein HY016_02585 [Nitrosomonadales bacterium]|nr:hypothetical protein [Nitrosomonadales bacterium]